MIIGIGTDLIEVERVIKACKKQGFLNRYFTDSEKALINLDNNKSAGNFAVKEAVSKMFGTGFGEVAAIDIEVLRNEHGKPYVNLYGKAKDLAIKQGITYIHVSISNTKKFANAFVVGEHRE
ncbi:MAG TPA: holo-ACP synthase [Clostridiales bacterium]|nr:holo-ACP synthase [Clostridiales bacterium]